MADHEDVGDQEVDWRDECGVLERQLEAVRATIECLLDAAEPPLDQAALDDLKQRLLAGFEPDLE